MHRQILWVKITKYKFLGVLGTQSDTKRHIFRGHITDGEGGGGKVPTFQPEDPGSDSG